MPLEPNRKSKTNMRVKENKGFALILTLWILAILSMWLLALSSSLTSNVSSVSYLKKDMEAFYLAKGAIRRLALELSTEKELGAGKRLKLIKGELLGDWIIDPKDWSIKKLKKMQGKHNIIGTIKAEDAKLPINKINKSILSKIYFITPSVASQIMAYKKAKERERGFSSINELLLIEEITKKIYFGTKKSPGLKDILTTYSTGRVYINAAPKEVIMALPGVDDKLARELEERIKKKPFTRVEQIQHVIGVTPPIYKSLKKWIAVAPSFYRIRARAVVDGVSEEAEAIIYVQNGQAKTVFMNGG